MKMLILAFVLTVGLLVPQLSAAAGTGSSHEAVQVSLPSLHLGPNERIFRFDCTVTSGPIMLAKTPYFWHMTIDNSIKAQIKANTTVGAAAITQNGLDFFKDFVRIDKPRYSEPDMPPFDVRVIVWISTDQDMTTFRSTGFSMKQLIVKPDPNE